MSADLLVVLDRKDMTVTLDGKTLKIKRPDAKPQTIPLGMIGQVVVHGKPMVSCDVWRALAERNVSGVVFPGRGGGDPAWLGAGVSSSVMNRIAQHRAFNDVETALAVARWIVRAKIDSQRRLAAKIEGAFHTQEEKPAFFNTDLQDNGFTQAIEKVRARMDHTLESLDHTDDIKALMGYEGISASAWFDFMKSILAPQWSFEGRNRRPPRDPVNALLSLSYVMAMSEVRKVVQQRGLDPAVGFLHAPYPGRDSFVLDVLEPLRAGADAFVLGLLDNALTPEMFTRGAKEGCRIGKEGRFSYYRMWAEYTDDWPRELLTGEAPEEALEDADKAYDAGDEKVKSLSFCARWVIQHVLTLIKS